HEMAARLRAPRHTVGVNVAAADTRTWFRHVVYFRKLGLRIVAQEAGVTAEYADGIPDGAVLRIRHHCIGAGTGDDALVFRRISRLIGIDEIVAFAVSVDVEHERRPTDGFFLVAGLFEDPCIDPAGDLAGSAQPQRI